MNTINQFVPITKIDNEKRMVYGYASTEAVDSDGEIVKLDAIKDALPDYMKFGNIREMHTNSAVGITKEANIDSKGLYLGVKVVDDKAWEKVKEEVYKGFSIGGRVVSKIKDNITKIKLSEISLVDRPANPEAVFDCIKGVEMKKSMYDVQALASVLDQLANIEDMIENEGEMEADPIDGEFADKLVAQMKTLGALLVERTTRETQELIEGEADEKAETIVNLKKGNIPDDKVACPNCNGKEGPMGTVNGEKCTTCDGKGYIDPPETENEPDQVGEVESEKSETAEPILTETTKEIVEEEAPETEKIEKAEQTTEERNSLNDSDFAYIDSKGERKLPINDEAHVKNAMARFSNTDFDNSSDKAKAKKKICAAANKYDIKGDFCSSEKAEMPDKTVIADSLIAKGLPADEKTISQVLEKLADEKVEDMIAEQSASQEEEIQANISKEETEKVIKALELLKLDQQYQSLYYPLLKMAEKSEQVDELTAKVESLQTLEERVNQIEKVATPVKVRSALVERYDDVDTNKINLSKRVDDVANRLKVNPNDLEALKLRDELFKLI